MPAGSVAFGATGTGAAADAAGAAEALDGVVGFPEATLGAADPAAVVGCAGEAAGCAETPTAVPSESSAPSATNPLLLNVLIRKFPKF